MLVPISFFCAVTLQIFVFVAAVCKQNESLLFKMEKKFLFFKTKINLMRIFEQELYFSIKELNLIFIFLAYSRLQIS